MIDFTNIEKTTERLILHPTREEDYSSIKKSLINQSAPKNKFDDEEVDLSDRYTLDFCKQSIKKINQSAIDDKSYLFRVFLKDSHEYIGGVIIKTLIRKNYQWAEIGYWLLNQYWGKGYGQEMVSSALDISFTNLSYHRIEAYIDIDNIASQKTAEKVGMKNEGIRKGLIYEEGEWKDQFVFSAINPTHKTSEE